VLRSLLSAVVSVTPSPEPCATTPLGSWEAAVQAAGLEPTPRGQIQRLAVCKAGLHPMVGDNVADYGHGRGCVACRRINDRKKTARRKARARLEQGLCVVCGEAPVRKGSLACGGCRAYLRDADPAPTCAMPTQRRRHAKRAA
jgi:hypothetical protein